MAGAVRQILDLAYQASEYVLAIQTDFTGQALQDSETSSNQHSASHSVLHDSAIRQHLPKILAFRRKSAALYPPNFEFRHASHHTDTTSRLDVRLECASKWHMPAQACMKNGLSRTGALPHALDLSALACPLSRLSRSCELESKA